MKRIVLILALSLCCLPAVAGDQVSRTERKLFLNAIAGNANEATRTFTLPLGGGSNTAVGNAYHLAVLHFNANFTATMSAVSMTCSVSDDGGTNLFVVQDCEKASGVCTSNDASWSKAITADKKWAWRVDVTGYTYGSCVVTITGGAADESLTVSGYLTTK